ncbi:hypothetical protein H105_07777 [Trichophyton soudanense CBS 452.61]|uniref:Uncharacterized protein n=1 Tax=Trichophyton soudanense CBS 452.61 TaxID=1215331 RepID=A0A022XHK1_TRISD|nr:hypothetical protein H105_07777 [Trichophyton soudanense CBS 452.61]
MGRRLRGANKKGGDRVPDFSPTTPWLARTQPTECSSLSNLRKPNRKGRLWGGSTYSPLRSMLGHDARTGGFLGGHSRIFAEKEKRDEAANHATVLEARCRRPSLPIPPDSALFNELVAMARCFVKFPPSHFRAQASYLGDSGKINDGVKRERRRQEAPTINPMTGQQLLSTQN